jgi:fumarylacetoacetate (FAA) hydrolase
MKLATLRDNSPDGLLCLVSRDLSHAAPAAGIASSLQGAIERWSEIEGTLRTLADAVEAGTAPGLTPLDMSRLAAPLPRAWQWLDGSAYPSHGDLMQKAFNLPPIETKAPLMYQGLSDRFLGPRDDVALPSEADGIDIEGEFGVILDHVPMGCGADRALDHVRLIVQINDWSLRAIAPVEMKTGFGWVQAKPACSMAPIALTPDELGESWSNGRIDLEMRSWINDSWFGAVPGAEGMANGFDELIAHAARTRSLVSGTVLGSGTVSSTRHAEVGSSCISERRAIETIETGSAITPFLRFGDTVRLEAGKPRGPALFGTINQRVVARG